jgi:hypothetical protein
MTIKEMLDCNYENGYELWLDKEGYHFDTVKEAYLYYLDHFATKEDFEYYKECANKDLREIADDINLIGMMFENVFNEKHHIYKLCKRSDGYVCRDSII